MLIKTRDVLAALLRLLPSQLIGRTFLGNIIYDLTARHNDISIDANFERIIRMRDGTFFKLDLRDRMSIEPFFTGRYEYGLINIIKTLLCSVKKPLVIDVGANIGLISIPIAKEIKPKGGRVHTFEVFGGNAKRLKFNADLNRLNNVIIYPYGLGDKNSKATIGCCYKYSPKFAKTKNTVILNNDKFRTNIKVDESFEIQIKRLDDIVRQERIDGCSLIKIDVEGYEYSVLKGGLDFIKEYKPIIVAEFSIFWMKYHSYSLKDFYALLKPLAYKVYHIHKGKLVRIEGESGYFENLVFLR